MTEILTTVVQHTVCSYKYCDTCFEGMKNESKGDNIVCAYCTNEIKEGELNTTDLDGDKEVTCEHCGGMFIAKEFQEHLNNCKVYLQTIEEDIKKNKFKDIQKTVNRSTFKCPFCESKNLERKDLITHVEYEHGDCPGVCPICVVQEYGDPNYVSQNLLGHMKHRHSYDMDTYMAYGETDDDVLAQVLAASMNEL
ncbi:unnamed protein product [Moneuplotes crassus]|uniref:Di19 zinc-binding domain-containing protein n=1 Tax=Euplotes crassus TaxID=5936 RepID=A0AAD1XUE4_EUPCR|nr:unnamed protein product [Moneuplotes crassus]